MAGAIRSFFAPQKSYAGLNNNYDLFRKAKLVPEDMWNTTSTALKDVWDMAVTIRNVGKNSSDTNNIKAFGFVYNYVFQDVCIDLITHDWNNENFVINISNPQNSGFGNVINSIVPPANIDDAVRLCDVPANDTNAINSISFFFDVDLTDENFFITIRIGDTKNRLNGAD